MYSTNLTGVACRQQLWETSSKSGTRKKGAIWPQKGEFSAERSIHPQKVALSDTFNRRSVKKNLSF